MFDVLCFIGDGEEEMGENHKKHIVLGKIFVVLQ
jgi:hypothetical protein